MIQYGGVVLFCSVLFCCCCLMFFTPTFEASLYSLPRLKAAKPLLGSAASYGAHRKGTTDSVNTSDNHPNKSTCFCATLPSNNFSPQNPDPPFARWYLYSCLYLTSSPFGGETWENCELYILYDALLDYHFFSYCIFQRIN